MKEKRFKEIVSEGIADLFYIWWQELKAVVKDQGVLISLSWFHWDIHYFIPLYIRTKPSAKYQQW